MKEWVGIVGIDENVGNGGSVGFDNVSNGGSKGGSIGFGNVVNEGNGGSIGFGNVVSEGKGGSVGLGNVSMTGKFGILGWEDCKRWRVARVTSILKIDIVMNKAKMKHLNAITIGVLLSCYKTITKKNLCIVTTK